MKGLAARRQRRKDRLNGVGGGSRLEAIVDDEEPAPLPSSGTAANHSKQRRPGTTRAPSLRMLRRSARMESYRQIHDWMMSSNEQILGGGDEDAADQLVNESRNMLQQYESSPLTQSDIVLVMQGWNKALAFSPMFLEAVWLQWRLLCAKARQPETSHSRYFPFRMVESNQDILAVLFKDRISEAEPLLLGLLDGAIRGLCPHTQTVARESYHPVADGIQLQHAADPHSILHLECTTTMDYLQLFARLGVPPSVWVHFVGAVAWAWDSHIPYAQDDDADDLELGSQSAVLRAVTQQIAVPAILAWKDLHDFGKTLEVVASKNNGKTPSPNLARAFWRRLEETDRMAIGERIYRKLFQDHPDLLDYFSNTDMDSLAVHLVQALDVMVKASGGQIAAEKGPFRSLMNHLGRIHLNMGVPSYAYPLMGHAILECLEPFFAEEEQRTKAMDVPTKADTLQKYFARIYSEVMSLVYYPVVRQEKLIQEAKEFYAKVRVELQWSDGVLGKRMTEIEQEIIGTGTYTQTIDEIQVGARLAWRNSAKCIGRISWNTLQVRDCRHVTKPEDVFAQVEEHLKIATAGTNIQSVMTIFRPLRPGESVGPRFWTEQFVRYAGYRDETSGETIGDPANVELTEYLLDNNMWEAPDPIGMFDVLPLVYKLPDREKPILHTLSKECLLQVDLEHPKNAEFAELGLKWTTVPVISNFRMNLGGVVYQNAPFNGWFMSTEITRNIMERYDAGPEVAEIFDIDVEQDPFWRQAASLEVDRAVIHSFQKNGFTIVDPHSVGESFCVHVRREREQHGLECPSQWSWIGGLVGPTNDTWHLEMRDFKTKPQYDYSVDGCALYNSLDNKKDFGASLSTIDSSMSSFSGSPEDTEAFDQIPKVAILYGSETGQAEGVARQLKRSLRALRPTVMTLDQAAGLKSLYGSGITHLLCITSTFGKGEPPTNARKFFDSPVTTIKNCSFSVLALGSTLYPDFCKAGIDLDTKLETAGMQRLTNAATKADEANGAEKSIKGWLDLVKRILLPNYIEQLVQLRNSLGPTEEKVINNFKFMKSGVMMEASIDTDDPPSIVLANENIAGPGSTKAVHKVTFELPFESTYTSGDHLAVTPNNPPGLVRRFLVCFETPITKLATQLGAPEGKNVIDFVSKRSFEMEAIEGSSVGPADVVFPLPSTLNLILTNELDLAMKGPFAVDLLSTCIESCEQYKDMAEVKAFTKLMQPYVDGDTHIDDFISHFPTVPHFFESYTFLASSEIVRLADLMTLLPRLQPRYYSISSSGKSADGKVSITAGVLTVETSRGAKLRGVCSHYLSKLKPNVDAAYIQIRPSSFRLPETLAYPMIMVGAGTGLAPMMGFLEELNSARSSGKTVGPVHLFFGCRTESDFLYSTIIRQYENSGLLTLYLALSRSTDSNIPKKYVQHVLADAGATVAELCMNPKTNYYVCGDAGMAQECQEAAIGTLRTHKNMSRVAAVQQLKKMGVEDRWQADVWGIVSDDYEASKRKMEKSKKASAKMWLSKFRRSTEEEDEDAVAT